MGGACRIELLGWLRVVQDDRATTRFETLKTGALLAYLSYHRGRSFPRDQLVELFWPECDLNAGRHSLSQSLFSLRRQLEAAARPMGMSPDGAEEGGVILANRAVVQLNAATVTTDVAEFEAALQAAGRASEPSERERQLVKAVELYQGELLPGHFDAWILQERLWLAESYFQALAELLRQMEQAGDLHRALRYARRGVSADPLREEAHRDLMRLYAAAGQPGAALNQYRELERILRQELAAEPDAATRSFARDLERAASSRRSPAADDGGPSAPIASAEGPVSAGVPPPAAADFQAGVVPHSPQRIANVPARIMLLHERRVQPDERLAAALETLLSARGHEVFVDRHTLAGIEWAQEVERQIRGADAVIPLLSAAAAQSEMLAYEIEVALEAFQQHGRPQLLPVRVRNTDPFPEPLEVMLQPFGRAVWSGMEENDRLAAELHRALENPHAAATSAREQAAPSRETLGRWEPVEGAVPVDSAFYVVRPTDGEFRDALARQDSIVLVKGARQMGKTSLLFRGLRQAREAGARVVLTDFQKLNASHLESAERLLIALGQWIAVQLDLEVMPQAVWQDGSAPNINFELYLRREVLRKVRAPMVWGLDEVDRLFQCDAGSELFSLFRSWHNERSLDPTGPWANLTLAIAYATEAHLFISDLNQSPFNVGTRLVLDDFTVEQVADLNRRYRGPLRSEDQITVFYRLVGGQPYLVRRGLHEMATRGLDLAAIERQGDSDAGIFGDHLRRMVFLLARDPELCDAVREVLQGKPCPTAESFYRLRSAGVMVGETARNARPRCQLYATYLEQHLL